MGGFALIVGSGMWMIGPRNSRSVCFPSPVCHRHVVFTLPEQLRPLLRKDPKIVDLLFTQTFTTAKSVFSYKCKTEITPGVMGVFHSFGNDLKFHPHFDCIVTEGGVNDCGDWIHATVSYRAWRRVWQYQVLTALKDYLPATRKNKQLIDILFSQYPQGFVVYAKNRISRDKDKFLKYIARYIRHPPIANSRIQSFDGQTVTISCKTEDEKKIHVTLQIFIFITAILLHLPRKGEHRIKYYGLYSTRKQAYYFKLLGFTNKLKRWHQRRLTKTPKCPRCGTILELIYTSPPKHPSIPPPPGTLITHWI